MITVFHLNLTFAFCLCHVLGSYTSISCLIALETYKTGHGLRGKLKWRPDEEILQALDAAFYKTFKVMV